jgi:AcrR family transcriptional regulator
MSGRGRPTGWPATFTMPSKTRYSRDPDAMRRTILDAARRLFVREGYGRVSMRRIAERIDYSAAALYLYFPAKADIFFALAEDGFRRFEAAMSPPGGDEDPIASLEDRFWRYYEFSKRQPEYFWLMFVDRSVPKIAADWNRLKVVARTRTEGVELVQRCIDAGLFPRGTSAPAAYHVLGTAIHGAAVHRLCGRQFARRDADLFARNALRAALAGLRAGVALDVPPTGRP